MPVVTVADCVARHRSGRAIFGQGKIADDKWACQLARCRHWGRDVDRTACRNQCGLVGAFLAGLFLFIFVLG